MSEVIWGPPSVLFWNIEVGKVFPGSLHQGLGIKLPLAGCVDAEPSRESVPKHQVVDPGQGEVVPHHKLEGE